MAVGSSPPGVASASEYVWQRAERLGRPGARQAGWSKASRDQTAVLAPSVQSFCPALQSSLCVE